MPQRIKADLRATLGPTQHSKVYLIKWAVSEYTVHAYTHIYIYIHIYIQTTNKHKKCNTSTCDVVMGMVLVPGCFLSTSQSIPVSMHCADTECLVPMGKDYKNIFMGLEIGQHSRKCSRGTEAVMS